MSPRLEHDIGEHHGLAGLQLHHSRERGSPLRFEVVAGAFFVVERTVLPPHFLSHLTHAEIGLQILLEHGQDISIDVSLLNLLGCSCFI